MKESSVNFSGGGGGSGKIYSTNSAYSSYRVRIRSIVRTQYSYSRYVHSYTYCIRDTISIHVPVYKKNWNYWNKNNSYYYLLL